MTRRIDDIDQLTDEHVRELALAVLRHVLDDLGQGEHVDDALDRISDRDGVVWLNTVAVELDEDDWRDAVERVAELFEQTVKHVDIPGITTP